MNIYILHCTLLLFKFILVSKVRLHITCYQATIKKPFLKSDYYRAIIPILVLLLLTFVIIIADAVVTF